MKTWKLTLEYDGTRYRGWQEQPAARTVQGELRQAAEDYFGLRVELGGAGRTDAGVHALAQVAHLRLKSPRGSAKRFTDTTRDILYGLNDRLPADINVLKVEEAHPTFHARHDAVARAYLYQIATRRTAFAKKYVWWVKDRLDVKAMAQAAQMFVGRHDFASFSETDDERAERSTIVVVESAEITMEGFLILFRIAARHFLWKMVRRLAGTLVEVGRHNLQASDVAHYLRQPSNDPAQWTAPPSGLFLERVTHSR
jgi:tRNA pseudouridine38-40 synthase